VLVQLPEKENKKVENVEEDQQQLPTTTSNED